MMSKEKQIEEMAVDMCRIDMCKHLPQEECNNTTCAHCEAEALYNAGYRKQEWISVEERLPEKSGYYLTYHNGVFSTLMYSAKHRLFNAVDGLSEEYCLKYNMKVSHWMPLPEAPKMKGGA